MKRKDHLSFPLIELLVVIAVIAIIAAILFPVFAQAREKARQAVCLSNLHQISLGSELYAQDYDDTFLWNPYPGFRSGSWVSQWALKTYHQQLDCADQAGTLWVVLLQPYVKGDGVFRCPSFSGFSVPVRLDDRRASRPLVGGIGYSINPLEFADGCRPHTTAMLRHPPSEVALFADASTGLWAGSPGIDQTLAFQIYPFATMHAPDGKVYWVQEQLRDPVLDPTVEPLTPVTPAGHLDGFNFAFADGHVRFLRPARWSAWRRVTAAFGVDGYWHGGHVEDREGLFPSVLME
jgi:prepilin-type processing-associated H-X9-DG protein